MTQQATLRDPTHEERFKIRRALETHFDDAQGAYLDGWSDQRIGKELNLPWAMVSKIREAAFGPIRVDPELVALRAEAAKLAAQLVEAAKAHAALVEAQAALEKRIEALTKARAA